MERHGVSWVFTKTTGKEHSVNVEVNGVCAYGGIGYAKLKLGVCMDVSVSVTIDEGIPIPCVVRHAANN